MERPASPAELSDLSLARVRERVSAYVYGNILVLAALATTTPHAIETGHAVVVVLATTGTTYLAHVLAHLVAHQIGADPGDPGDHGGTVPDRHSLRDAVPIFSSGSVPVLILLVTWLADLPPTPALLVAAVTVVLRLAGLGVVTSRFAGRRSRLGDLWTGVVLAAVSGVVVGLKIVLTH